jgi:hypothetical protein
MAMEFDGSNSLNPVGFAYSTSAGPFQLQTWPRVVFHATEEPKVVGSKEEFEAIQPDGWTLVYQHKDYPKMMFAPNGDTAVVANPEEEAAQASAEGGPWADAPHGSTDPQMSRTTRSTNFTLQDKAEAIRDSRRLSLDYVAVNQALDCYADNAPMRAISPKDTTRPNYKPTETEEQVRKRREEDDERRNRGEVRTQGDHVEHNKAAKKNDK